MGKKKRPRLIVAGLHAGGGGYPNAEQTIKLLSGRLHLEVAECGAWLPESMQLWRLARQGGVRFIFGVLGLVFGNLLSLLKTLCLERRAKVPVYVPYPSAFFLWWLSFFPKKLRPPVIADAYISPWDSMFCDRRDGRSIRIFEGGVKRFEARAYRAAKTLIVDTDANKNYMAEQFGLPIDCLCAFPLAIEEGLVIDYSKYSSVKIPGSTIRVVFVGTLIPLHGIGVILEAIEHLLEDHRLNFSFVGDGQMAPLLEDFILKHGSSRMEWKRGWYSLSSIMEEICQADICLGVFGGAGKASRVLPFKLYLYLASGKPVISQRELSTPGEAPFPPISAVVEPDGEALAQAILEMANDPVRRDELGRQAKEYYVRWLSNDRVLERWSALIGG